MDAISHYTSSSSSAHTESDSDSDAESGSGIESSFKPTSGYECGVNLVSGRGSVPGSGSGPISLDGVVHQGRPRKRIRSRGPGPGVVSDESTTLPASSVQAAQTVALPPVLPLPAGQSRNRFLIHLHIPIPSSDSALAAASPAPCPVRSFVRYLESRTRLRMVGHPVKASLISVNHQFHISLSRPVFVSCDDVHSVVAALRSAISNVLRGTVRLAANVIALPNGKGRKVFFAAPVVGSLLNGNTSAKDKNLALTLIDVINSVFCKHKLPPHFERPIPHLSFAYTETVDILPLFNVDTRDSGTSAALASNSALSEKDVPTLPVNVSSVMCSVGKSRYRFNLRDP